MPKPKRKTPPPADSLRAFVESTTPIAPALCRLCADGHAAYVAQLLETAAELNRRIPAHRIHGHLREALGWTRCEHLLVKHLTRCVPDLWARVRSASGQRRT